MIHSCPQCGQSLIIQSPGAHQCPNCGALMEIKAEEFAWEKGEHLNDFMTPPDEDINRENIESPDEEAGSQTSDETPIAAIASAGEIPKSEPAHVHCEICVSRPAVRACKSCGKLVCETCSIIDADSRPLCSNCRVGASAKEPLFENYRANGFIRSFFQALHDIFLKPSEFFSGLKTPGPFWPGVFFGVLVLFPVRIITVIFFALTLESNIADIESQLGFTMPDSFLNIIHQPAFLIGMLASSLLLQPLFILADIVISGAIYHLTLIITGGMQGKFEDSIRVSGYGKLGETPAVIPYVGAFIAIPWAIVLTTIGLHKIHKIPKWKAALAACMPYLICCCGILAVTVPLLFMGVFAAI